MPAAAVMSTPAALTHPDCRCGHDRNAHFEDGFAPQCTAPRCECLHYQPAAGENLVTLRASTDDGHTSVDQLIAAGKRSSAKRIAALAAELERRANRLRVLLDEQRTKAEIARKAEGDKQAARREIERLEAELAAAKAKLRNNPAASVKRDTLGRRVVRDPTPKVCPDCGQTFTALGPHRAKKHGYRRAAS